jgi:TrmH family RNA methyltransferase
MSIMEKISSLQNPRFKLALRLHTSRGRQKQNRIIVFGSREVSRALDAGVRFSEIMIGGDHADQPQVVNFVQAMTSSIESGEVQCFELDSELFAKLAYGDRVDGLIGIADRPNTSLERFEKDKMQLVIVIESLEKPGNVGAIARSADGCGADAILLADPQTDAFHPNAIRASMASVFSVPIAVGSSSEIQTWLRDNKFDVYVATPEAKHSLYETDLSGRCAFVFGNEANGLSRQWRDRGDWKFVKLPMLGIADSLNVSRLR